MKVCPLFEAYQVKVVPHNPFVPMAAIAHAHLSAAVSSFPILEYEQMTPLAITPPIKIVNGYIEVPSESGFWVDLTEKEIARNQAKVEHGTYEALWRDRQVFAPTL